MWCKDFIGSKEITAYIWTSKKKSNNYLVDTKHKVLCEECE